MSIFHLAWRDASGTAQDEIVRAPNRGEAIVAFHTTHDRCFLTAAEKIDG
jgi:hypothetical protein